MSITYLLILFFTTAYCLGCDPKLCYAPYCTCKTVLFVPYESCNDGFSGDHCQCPVSAVSGATDPSWFFYDGSYSTLTVSKGGLNEILSGAFRGLYVSSDNGKTFTQTNLKENVWKAAKLASGTYLVGTPVSLLRSTDRNTFTKVVDFGVQRGIESLGKSVYAIVWGTETSLQQSDDDGITWTKITNENGLPPSTRECKPNPIEGQPELCFSSARSFEYIAADKSRGKLFTILGGYGLFVYDQSSWSNFGPSLVDVCGDLDLSICHLNGMAIVNDRLYIWFLGKLFSLSLSNPEAKWRRSVMTTESDIVGVISGSPSIVYVLTSTGLHTSKDNGATFVPVNETPCGKKKAPVGSGGLVFTGKDVIFGTTSGLWRYRADVLQNLLIEQNGIQEKSSNTWVSFTLIVGCIAFAVLVIALVIVRRKRQQTFDPAGEFVLL